MRVKNVFIGFITNVNNDWLDISDDTRDKMRELDNREDYLYNNYGWFARDPNGKLWRYPVQPVFNKKINKFKFYAYKEFTEFDIPEITSDNSPVLLIRKEDYSLIGRNIYEYDIANQQGYHITDCDSESELGITQLPAYDPDYDDYEEHLIHSYEVPSFLGEEVIEVIDNYAVDLASENLYFTMSYDSTNQVMTFKIGNQPDYHYFSRSEKKYAISKSLSLEGFMNSANEVIMIKFILDGMVELISKHIAVSN